MPMIKNAVEEGLKREIAAELDKKLISLLNAPNSEWLEAIDAMYASYSAFDPVTDKGRTLCAELRKMIDKLTESS